MACPLSCRTMQCKMHLWESAPQEVLYQITSCSTQRQGTHDSGRRGVEGMWGRPDGLWTCLHIRLGELFKQAAFLTVLRRDNMLRSAKPLTGCTEGVGGPKWTTTSTQADLVWFPFQLILWIFHLIPGFFAWACENLLPHSSLPTCTWCLPAGRGATKWFCRH